MNTIRLRVAEENREAVFNALNERDIDFITIPIEDNESVVEAPVPTDALGEVLDATREAGLDDDYIVVLNAINTTTPTWRSCRTAMQTTMTHFDYRNSGRKLAISVRIHVRLA